MAVTFFSPPTLLNSWHLRFIFLLLSKWTVPAHVPNTIFTQVKPMWFLMSSEEGGVEKDGEVPEFRTMQYLSCGKKKNVFQGIACF